MADLTRDPRLTPARPDLAAKHLEGKVEALRFVTGEEFEVFDGVAPVRRDPFGGAMLDTQALKGERVTIYERSAEGWDWGQLHSDGYVGWLPDLALYPPGPPATHKVTALRSFAFPGPSIKLPPVDTLPLGARLAVARLDGGFAITHDGQYVPAQHVSAIDAFESDFVAVAERFLGTPYLWGGKSSLGIDCSGLVQVALNACGLACPRDSDMQQAQLGRALSVAEMQSPQRGDLMFWKGHVAIVRDADSIVHANAHAMATAIEGIGAAIARIAAAGSDLAAIRRLDSLHSPASDHGAAPATAAR
ncbi:cell wall-associated NlpC family hydrolase [Rhodopseudomonas rhenobacensis]|uniref:Cell wall-associated NlpC family hydrolase n=1 Tax=Rhodopseudomonas rhenobacensis TaxID=87461 RepID=A0A7W7Z495_9BRAD|nr:NlpC/P60 family protein [Rhodopseudomonas rhenobacensis]MBB5047352.1 cell wall-associated NlpC family hydrolase [Rhodopseudomonas rhenobacensis]